MSEKRDAVDLPGVVVRRTQEGYTWAIAVAAASSSLADMLVAVDTAERVDEVLQEKHANNLSVALPTKRKG